MKRKQAHKWLATWVSITAQLRAPEFTLALSAGLVEMCLPSDVFGHLKKSGVFECYCNGDFFLFHDRIGVLPIKVAHVPDGPMTIKHD